MNNKKDELMKFIEQLFKEVYHTNNKLRLHIYVHNKFVDHPEVAEMAPSFFTLTMDSLFNDAIIRMAKLFDKKAYGTLFKLLNSIEMNTDLFSTEKKQILLKISAHRKLLTEEYSTILDSLKTWRDKNYAHWDKEYFFEDERPKLGNDSPMSYGDLFNLLRASTNIINYYLRELRKECYTLDNSQIEEDVDVLFKALSSKETMNIKRDC
ncbi:hypothetical protein [Priestia koreensis]|uniref:AbiU2 domain-containing protein n=1 Tax=Priestia koreensis TaxID=284581 RepID=UPI0020410B23|nr:hypothetical protein [Priestia koreensis]MCM3002918.1 hypothetical protein [Priestia koreensis]